MLHINTTNHVCTGKWIEDCPTCSPKNTEERRDKYVRP